MSSWTRERRARARAIVTAARQRFPGAHWATAGWCHHLVTVRGAEKTRRGYVVHVDVHGSGPSKTLAAWDALEANGACARAASA